MSWIALVTTLPTSPSATRVRIWRALKATGCGGLRDGVYLLPDRPGCNEVFDVLADEVRGAGGVATRLAFPARDAERQAQFEALFDRAADYKAFEAGLARQRRVLRIASESAGRRLLRRPSRGDAVPDSLNLDALLAFTLTNKCGFSSPRSFTSLLVVSMKQ